MEENTKSLIEKIRKSLKNKYLLIGEFMSVELQQKDTMETIPIKKSRQTVAYSVLVLLFCVALLIISIFKSGLPVDLILIVMGTSLLIAVLSAISGSVYYQKYKRGEYMVATGFIESISRNYVTGSIMSVMVKDENGNFRGFNLEPGIDIKKRGQYEFCYYESENGEPVITEVKMLGKVSRKEYRNNVKRSTKDN